MLTAVVSGQRAGIFMNLLSDIQAESKLQNMPVPSMTKEHYDQCLGIMGNHRISHVITLSNEN